jgi:hypothetical protein
MKTVLPTQFPRLPQTFTAPHKPASDTRDVMKSVRVLAVIVSVCAVLWAVIAYYSTGPARQMTPPW